MGHRQLTIVPAAGATMWGCGWYIPVFITVLTDDCTKETACKQTHAATEKRGLTQGASLLHPLTGQNFR